MTMFLSSRWRSDPRAGVLTIPRFRWLLIAECVGSAGTELSLVAISIAVLEAGGTALDVGLVLMARTLPPIGVLLVGGALIDRLPRGRIIVSASVIALIVQAVLGIEFLSGTPSLGVLLTLQAVLGAVTAVLRPATVGMLAQVVPGDRLQAGNSLLAIAGNTASILGPASAGLLLLVISPASLILIDALSFGLSALFVIRLWNVPAIYAHEPQERRAYWSELRAGWIHVLKTRWLFVTICQGLVFQTSFAVFFILGPVLALQNRNGGSIWALMATGFGVGAIVGSFVALHYRPRVPLVAMQVILLFSVPLLILMTTTAPLLFVLPLTVIAGVSASLGDTLWETYFQQVTPGHMLGRVSSIASLGASALRPLGYLFAGQAAVAIGTSITFGVAGAALLGSIIVTLAVIVPMRALLLNPNTEMAAKNDA